MCRPIRYVLTPILFLTLGTFSNAAYGTIIYSGQSISALSNIFGAGFTTPPDPGGTISATDGNYGGEFFRPSSAFLRTRVFSHSQV
jgi:hypothetical protein